MVREPKEVKLMWNNGGMGFGACQIGGMFDWATSAPSERISDLTGIVAVTGPSTKYTALEEAILLKFAVCMTQRYDEMFGYRLGANLICINKIDNNRWTGKRLTWDYPVSCDNLPELLTRFSKTHPDHFRRK